MSVAVVSFKREVFFYLSLLAALALMVMAGFYFYAGAMVKACFDLFFALALMANLLYCHYADSSRWSFRLGLGLGAFTVIALAWVDWQSRQGTVLWFFTLPLVSIYLLGRREGSFWSFLYFMVLALIVFRAGEGFSFYGLRFGLAYLLVFSFTYIYEWLQVQTYNELQATKNSLEKVSARLACYLSPQLRDEIVAGGVEPRIESRRRKMTFFFSDIADFTRTTDHLEPEDLAFLLNTYFGAMVRIAMGFGATIDKFVGDGLVIFFGAPHSRGVREDAVDCVRMALAMQEELVNLTRTWVDQGISESFQVRMGINSGYGAVGNFGADQRLEYTAIGSQVNLAARLESMADPGQILLSRATWLLVREVVDCRPLDSIMVKGLAEPLPVYQVEGMADGQDADGGIVQHQGIGFSLELDPDQLDSDERRQAIRVLHDAAGRLEKGLQGTEEMEK